MEKDVVEKKEVATAEATQAEEKKTSTRARKTTSRTKRKSTTKASVSAASAAPYVYVGATDVAKQLKHRTAYLSIPAGADKKQFVALSDYPGWLQQQKERKR